MNVREGLIQIRARLVERGARPATLKLVDDMTKRASVPGAERAQGSMTQLVRMLARTPVANADVGVYDDLVGLQDELEGFAAERAEEAAAEEAKPIPKSKKYYRQLKERERKQAEKSSS